MLQRAAAPDEMRAMGTIKHNKGFLCMAAMQIETVTDGNLVIIYTSCMFKLLVQYLYLERTCS